MAGLSPAQEGYHAQAHPSRIRNWRCRAARLVWRASLRAKPNFAVPRRPPDDAGPPRAPRRARHGRSLIAVEIDMNSNNLAALVLATGLWIGLAAWAMGGGPQGPTGSPGRARVPPKSRATRRWSAAAILFRLALSLRLSS